MSLKDLRERRNAKAKEAQTLNAKYPAGTKMPKDEIEKLDALISEVNDLDDAIERQMRLDQIAGEQSEQDVQASARDRNTRNPSQHGDESQALRAFLISGPSALTEDQRRAMLARQAPDIQNAMSTTTPAEGGYTTAPEYVRKLVAALKAYGGVRQAATVITTATGTQLNWPTTDATSEEGEIVGQNAPATGADTTFGNQTIDVYRYSSKKIALPWELLQDSFLDIEGYIQSLLAVRLGRIQAKHHATGTGSGQPRGLVPAISLGKTGTTGQTATVTYDDLVDLEHSIDPLYRAMPGAGWMMHDQSVKVVRKIKDTDGRPIFVPGYESGSPGGAPTRLNDKPLYICQELPTMAANAKSILFGDYSKYVIRDVMDLTLFRMTDSAFTLNGQVGFVAFQRSGANYIDVGGAVKYYANSAT